MGNGGEAMPLTEYQAMLARLLSSNRSQDSYLAGGAALHLEPNSRRYSNDLDYFCDSVERVATAFDEDRRLLEREGFTVAVEISQPGFIRSVVSRSEEATKVEWGHDSAWRFMPVVADERVGYLLHPVDLAVNKVLALAGRDEPRDFLDVLHVHRETLPLGALCWAAAGKDPGFTPDGLIQMLRRRGKYHPEDFFRLRLVEAVDLISLKAKWLAAIEDAEGFIGSRPAKEVGCLYYSTLECGFVQPSPSQPGVFPHFGRPKGVLPVVIGPGR